MATEATKEWREAIPASSDDEEGSSLDGSATSTSYEEEQLTLRPKKRARGEEDDDSNFDPKGETRASRVDTRVPPEDDTVSQRLSISILHKLLIDNVRGASRKYVTNASSCPRQLPLVPIHLEYPNDGDQEGAEEAPTPSIGTSSTCSKDKSNLKRGQHGRHQTIEKKVHAIHSIGSKGQPLEPCRIIGAFSN
jgi:hypothetical protein